MKKKRSGEERFESSIGTIILQTLDCCKNCPRFEADARETCKTDSDGKVIWTAESRTIRDGLLIRCRNFHLCEWVKRDLIERLKGEAVER